MASGSNIWPVKQHKLASRAGHRYRAAHLTAGAVKDALLLF